MRPIDADRLLEEKRMHLYYHLPNGDVAIPLIDIKNAPSADRPTGKWIGEYEAQSKCSICGKNEDEFIDGWGEWETWRKSRYCPNCGARMENGDT